ncbi:MAG: metal-sulfur cluster assembly factor [Candidatus Rokubacteria bacterium]|nr:metal-sulfur cluster assembly factor [Candidatus Rokubacteria bacterium]
MGPSEEETLEALKQVYDPEIPVDVVNLGLVYEVAIDAGTVRVRMTTTSPGCPVGDFLAQEVERALRKLDGVKAVPVELVWDPPWTPELMSPAAKETLGWRS